MLFVSFFQGICVLSFVVVYAGAECCSSYRLWRALVGVFLRLLLSSWEMIAGVCSLLPYNAGCTHGLYAWPVRIYQKSVGYLFCSFKKKRLFFHLVLISQIKWSTPPACRSLLRFFSKSYVDGTNSSEMCVCCLCIKLYALLYVCVGIGFRH